jgi:two-component system, OmpR family, phosphate regulon sensor histidine kinase PhoR
LILRRFFWQTLVTFLILVIALSSSLYALLQTSLDLRLSFLLSTLVALGVGTYLAVRVSRPIERLRQRLEKVAAGELYEVVDLSKNETIEIFEIARSTDQIAAQLRHRIDVIQRQSDEQEAVLGSMDEGLFAVDRQQIITLFNPAAAKLFRVQRQSVVGRPLPEVVRVPELIALVQSAFGTTHTIEEDIEMLGDSSRYLRLHLGPLRNRSGESYGVVVVVSDVTRIRELEGMRKNFVANVSHELRTPLTSIQGFAETLLNPAVTEPTEVRRFLEIIQRHANRLGRIIEDILSLSRIEKDAELAQIEKKSESLNDMLSTAVELCEVKAQKKNISLSLKVAADLRVVCDRYLIEQAIVNLIDNAIRYSDPGKTIFLRASRSGATVNVEVEDQGVGIPQKHLSRIFERFYRVDRARSRELGGTGLGLAIVKHIVQAHGGTISVESFLGQGTKFSISLPQATS